METAGESPKSERTLPADLPTSLDDRHAPVFGGETEVYDGWAGRSQFLTSPPINFNLALDDNSSFGGGDLGSSRLQEDDDKLVQMLVSQARLKEDVVTTGEDVIIADKSMPDEEKRETLQSMFTMAASNGELERVKAFLNGHAKNYIDVNAPDAEGTPSLIYASCFGHQDVVLTLLDAGADVDKQDKNQWSSLMWAMTNRHKAIVKLLLDHGADPDAKSSTGRTASDFLEPNSEMLEYLHERGYSIGNAGVTDDFYNAGLSEDRFEEEMAENEMKRRMMMESAFNLEVDLGNLGLDEQPESPSDEDGQEFVWDRCLNDQMFVFQESELDRILDIIITNMTPQRSPSQKPVPANILFLSARYAHYYQSADLLQKLMHVAMEKINKVIDKHQWDMTILAFWVSNATLLLHYLKKDGGLLDATAQFQLQLADLVNEIHVFIVCDAERRMDKVLDAAMLDHETIPGFEDVHFQSEWKIFRSKPKVKAPEPFEKRYRPPSPKRRAQTSPRNITSLLSSTLFVLDLYDIHSVIISQVISQLLYWIGAELFNRILSNRKYLARTKAMQIRMNVSTLEDWARANSRQPGHYENGSMTSSGETTVEAARRHLEPVVQLLQWLQCFSSFGEDFEALVGTIQQLPRLSPQQLMHSVKYYRAEVGEKSLPKSALKYLSSLQQEVAERRLKHKKTPSNTSESNQNTPTKPQTQHLPPQPQPQPSPSSPRPPTSFDDEQDAPENLLMDPSLILPFSLPTSTDMLVSYGAGFGGMNRERARRYIPSVPPEFLAKFDTSGKSGSSSADSRGWQ